MDNSKIQPINQLSFLTSCLVLTVNTQKTSPVRAHGDLDFQRLQELTRKCPYELQNSNDLKKAFLN